MSNYDVLLRRDSDWKI